MTEIYGHKPVLDTATFRLVQDGNTMGTTEDVETLEVRLETQLPGETPFFVIKTEGWSFDLVEIECLLRSLIEVTKGLAHD